MPFFALSTLLITSSNANALGPCLEAFSVCFKTYTPLCDMINIQSKKEKETEWLTTKARAFCTLGVQSHCFEWAEFKVGKQQCEQETAPRKGTEHEDDGETDSDFAFSK